MVRSTKRQQSKLRVSAQKKKTKHVKSKRKTLTGGSSSRKNIRKQRGGALKNFTSIKEDLFLQIVQFGLPSRQDLYEGEKKFPDWVEQDIEAKYRGFTSKGKETYEFIIFFHNARYRILARKPADNKKIQLLDWKRETKKEQITKDIREKTGIDFNSSEGIQLSNQLDIAEFDRQPVISADVEKNKKERTDKINKFLNVVSAGADSSVPAANSAGADSAGADSAADSAAPAQPADSADSAAPEQPADSAPAKSGTPKLNHRVLDKKSADKLTPELKKKYKFIEGEFKDGLEIVSKSNSGKTEGSYFYGKLYKLGSLPRHINFPEEDIKQYLKRMKLDGVADDYYFVHFGETLLFKHFDKTSISDNILLYNSKDGEPIDQAVPPNP